MKKILLLVSLVFIGRCIAVPYTGWASPYPDNTGSAAVLLHFNETSGSTASNSGNTVYGVPGGAYIGTDASTNLASGAGVPASGFGNSANLDGINDTVRVDHHWSMVGDITSIGFTLECWFKADVVGTSTGRVISKYDGTGGFPGGRNYDLHLNGAGKLRFFAMRSDGQPLDAGYAGILSSTTIETGQWYHTAVQYNPDANKWQMFVNGVLEAESGTFTAWVIGDFASNLHIGSYAGTGHFFDGQIDEVRLSRGYYDFAAVPEPCTLILFGAGVLGIIKKRK